MGKWSVAAHSKACGAIRFAANAAAVSVMTRSSSSSLNMLQPCLFHRRNDELRAVAARGPALGHGLDLGVELDRRRPVLVEITKARSLPTPERVVGHRHRD